MQRYWMMALVLSPLAASVAWSDEIPPRSAMPLSAVLKSLTKAGYEAVTEVSFDDGLWEVEVLQRGEPLGLRVHPDTAQVLRKYPDEPHPRLSAEQPSLAFIARRLEKAGYTPIKKAEFESGTWEVEALRGRDLRELIVDANGKIIRDQRED
jgi:hypothetical protein